MVPSKAAALLKEATAGATEPAEATPKEAEPVAEPTPKAAETTPEAAPEKEEASVPTAVDDNTYTVMKAASVPDQPVYEAMAPKAEPAKPATPEPAKAPTPEPAKAPTPEPAKPATPEPAKVATPEPAKVPTPEPAPVPQVDEPEIYRESRGEMLEPGTVPLASIAKRFSGSGAAPAREGQEWVMPNVEVPQGRVSRPGNWANRSGGQDIYNRTCAILAIIAQH
jgi:hypothetical protein